MKKQFMIYAYHPPMKGVYEHDRITPARYMRNKAYFDGKYQVKFDENSRRYFLYDVVYEEDGKTVKDFRTVEQFKMQRECGMNVLYLQRNAVEYSGEPFETSELKLMLDRAYEAGTDKVILFDSRLHALSASRTPLIGDGAFRDMDELVAYCKACIAPYKNHPAFFGVYLLDEPTWQTLPQVCLMSRALKAACKDIFIQLNLLPLAGDAAAVTGTGKTSASLFVDVSQPENQGITVAQAYRKYLETYAELSGTESITMDSYPIREQGNYEDWGSYENVDTYKRGDIPTTEHKYFVLPLHFPTLQIHAEACRKFGCVSGGVSNSCAMIKMRDDESNTVLPCHKAPNEQDMRYQLNAYMAFGAQIYSYYIYWARRDNGPGCYHLEGSTVVSQTGEKLPLYYALQKIHAEMQKFAPILCEFSFENSTCLGETKYLKHFTRNELQVKAELLTGEAAIVTQLKDKAGRRLYAVVNPTAPSVDGSDCSVKVRLRFAEDSVKAVSQRTGESQPSERTVEITLPYGETQFFLAE